MPLKDLFSLDMSAADGREGNNKDFSATIVIHPFKNILKKKKKKDSVYYQHHLAEHFTADPELVPNMLGLHKYLYHQWTCAEGKRLLLRSN